jgi:hypothetical protein
MVGFVMANRSRHFGTAKDIDVSAMNGFPLPESHPAIGRNPSLYFVRGKRGIKIRNHQ